MIPTGGKLWFAVTALSLVGAVVYAVASGGEWFGSLVLGSIAIGAAVLGGLSVATADGDVAVGVGADAVPVRSALPSPWPALAGVGFGAAVVGLAGGTLLFEFGLVVLVVVAAEWLVQAWAERSTGDHEVNQQLRNRLMFPVEVPVLAMVGVGFLAFSFSRILLAVSKEGAWAVAIVAAVAILGVAALVANRPHLSSSFVSGIVAVGALAFLAVGVIGAVAGEREFKPHHAEHSEDAGDEVNYRSEDSE